MKTCRLTHSGKLVPGKRSLLTYKLLIENEPHAAASGDGGFPTQLNSSCSPYLFRRGRRIFFWNILAARSTLPCPVQHLLWIFLTEGLRDVAVPAHRQVRLENLRQFFRCHFIPLHTRVIRGHQRRVAVMPVNVGEGLLPIRARLASVPLVHHIPDQAGRRVCVHLREAVLPAILPLWPACALVQPDVRLAENGLARRF